MDKQEIIDLIKEIGTIENDVERREKLTTLTEEVSSSMDKLEELTNTNTALTEDNEILRSANMKLFLKVGEPKTDEEIKRADTGIENKETTKREFTDLFNEKGGIK